MIGLQSLIIAHPSDRFIQVGQDVFLVFHTWLVDKNSGGEVGGRVHLWDMERRVKTKLHLNIKLQRTEINWTPLDKDGQLYLTYRYDHGVTKR